jgi:hypothetical protein
MATAIGKNAPKYGARHPSCTLKHAIKFPQKIGKAETHL